MEQRSNAKKVFSIMDTKSGAYGPLFVCHTNGEAERQLHSLVNDGKSLIAQYPEDFDLMLIAEWDDRTGRLDALPAPMHVLKAIQFKPEQPVRGQTLEAVQ